MKSKLVVLGLVAFAGCPSSHSNDAGTGGGFGGGFVATGGGTGGGTPDAGPTPPCHCQVDGNTMTVSWDCYCATFGCGFGPSPICPSPYDTTSIACGLRVDYRYPAGRTFVFDATGTQVGASLMTDTGEMYCPDDSSVHALFLRSGIFPDAGCTSDSCDCVDGGVSASCTATAVVVDAGAPCDCASDGSVLTMSWGCFCNAFGCDTQPVNECSPARETFLACGLRTDVAMPTHQYAVFDHGVLIGREFYSDTSPYVCPDNHALTGNTVHAGVFPDAGCAQTACDCVDGGIACP